ncbi:MAG: S8 family serine peptidase, partial [bacterium]
MIARLAKGIKLKVLDKIECLESYFKQGEIMKRIVIFALILAFVPMLFGATGDAEPKTRSSQTWAKAYGTSSGEEGYAVCQTTDGGYMVLGSWDGVSLLKVDSSGNMLWRKSYSIGLGYSMKQTSDNGYIIAGQIYLGPGNYDFLLAKTDSLGDTLWTKIYGGGSYEKAKCVDQTIDNGYIIVGFTWSYGAGATDCWVVRTDSIGDTLWTRTYGGSNYDYAYSVQQTTDKGYIIGGSTCSSGTRSEDFWLIKTDSLGNTLWTKRYDYYGNNTDFCNCVQQTTDNGYIMTGYTGALPGHILTIKTDSLGDTLWTNQDGGMHTDMGYQLVQTVDGCYAVTGYRFNGANGGDCFLMKIDSTGTKLWHKSYGGTENENGLCIEQTTDKGYILVGKTESFGAGGYDILLIKTDSSGYAPMEPDITTAPSELVFDYNSKSTEYSTLYCPSVFKVSEPVIVPALEKKMAEASKEELIPIIIIMSEQLDMDFLYEHACKLSKQDRRQWVILQAQALSQSTQQGVLSYLRAQQTKGQADRVYPLWIVNSIRAKVTKDVIREISMNSGTGRILYDDDCVHIIGEPSGTAWQDSVRDVVWGVDKIRADSVWTKLGYTGEGIIIGNMDTGVNYNHADLADHMWDGGTLYPHHGWNFVSGNDDPMDDNGHGTHTAGTNAGDGTSGTQTGVAPDAQIIAVKTLDASGAGSLGNMAGGVQFCIYHGVDVISMSSGIENPDDGTKNWCRAMCAYAFAADLPMALAAGNGITGSPGSHYPIPHDIYTPGDVPAPWYGSSV